jgi:N6-L-threonylcarbamoyladenine synthase
VLKNGRSIRSNVVCSQIVHTKFGGVVPELASREHIKTLLPIVQTALDQAEVDLKKVQGIAVTYGPGLVGSLLVGLSFAKALAYSLGIPFIGVHHIEGHVFANFLEHRDLRPPFVCLVVSGGHSDLILVTKMGQYEILGQTRDDAAGEAFDKVAKLLDVGYPGGPLIDELSGKGNKDWVRFPRAYLEEESYDFSFSGLKTAVALFVKKKSRKEIDSHLNDIAASFQEAVVDVLVDKTINAANNLKIKKIALAGGVARNSRLREKLSHKAKLHKARVFYPSPILCTDNAAMIAAAGDFYLSKGKSSGLDLNAVPYAKLTAQN